MGLHAAARAHLEDASVKAQSCTNLFRRCRNIALADASICHAYGAEHAAESWYLLNCKCLRTSWAFHTLILQ